MADDAASTTEVVRNDALAQALLKVAHLSSVSMYSACIVRV